MNPFDPSAGAYALSSRDVANAHNLLVHSCEDCACPVSSELERPEFREETVVPTDVLIRAREVLELPLDDEHRVLFNPLGNGGVVVVNRSARAVFRAFDEPRAAGGWDVVSKLAGLDLLHPADRAPQRRFRTSRELTAWLHVTNACNLRCPYCYVSKSNEHMAGGVGRETVAALVRSAVDHDFRALKLKYAGGEASLNSSLLLELHDHASLLAAEHDLPLRGVLLSNGVSIPDRLVDDLVSRRIRVMISLDGIGAAHDAVRPTVNGKPSSALVLRTIDRLVERGLPPHLSITITNRNVSGLAEVVRYALDRELTFSFNFFRDNDCASRFADLRYEEQSMIAALGEAFAVIAERLPPWSVLGSILDRGQLLEPRQRSCGVGDDYVVIDQRGGIAKCHMEITDTLGNVHTDDPVALIRDDSVGIRNLLVEEKEGCRTCTWRYWCSGGCSVATFRATGRFDVKSPNCNIYRAIYPEALRLEGLRLLKYAVVG